MYACIIPQKDIEFIYTKGFQTVSHAFQGGRDVHEQQKVLICSFQIDTHSPDTLLGTPC